MTVVTPLGRRDPVTPTTTSVGPRLVALVPHRRQPAIRDRWPWTGNGRRPPRRSRRATTPLMIPTGRMAVAVLLGVVVTVLQPRLIFPHHRGDRVTTRTSMTNPMGWVVVVVEARPLVRNIRSTHEFERLLQKHATDTGLPVLVDFYSDSCGPCRQMAPIFKKLAGVYQDKVVFVKVDTNAQPELSSRYQVRSLPTFLTFVNGHKSHQFVGGVGEQGLQQEIATLIRTAELENVDLTLDHLTQYYHKVDPSKDAAAVAAVHSKCVDLNKTKRSSTSSPGCVGNAANQLARKLKKKYGTAPKLVARVFAATGDEKSAPTTPHAESSSRRTAAQAPTTHAEPAPPSPPRSTRTSSSSSPTVPTLDTATLEQLQAALEARLDAIRDAQVDAEDDKNDDDDDDTVDDEEHAWDPWNHRKWSKSSFPERVVIVGGGPAGMAAAIYAARAGLSPLVIAPSLGGQLQGKGVDVENYPGLFTVVMTPSSTTTTSTPASSTSPPSLHPVVQAVTGPAVVAAMRQQAAYFGAYFEDDLVVGIDTSVRPLVVVTNATGRIATHTIIVATGAESNWLGVPGEYELRGGGVSSCATCDGFLYSGQHTVVVGGGDTAMEEALVLARTSAHVTVVHRRDSFRASTILANRVLTHPKITVRWNTTVTEIVGKPITTSLDEPLGDDDSMAVHDLDSPTPLVMDSVKLRDVSTGALSRLACNAVFVAIGHTPATQFLTNVVEFDPVHSGYLRTQYHPDKITQTSVPGIFAAGDVSDPVYRQAVTSAGSGAAAALDAERYLSEHGLGNDEAEWEAALLAEVVLATASSSKGDNTNDAQEATRAASPLYAEDLVDPVGTQENIRVYSEL